jgi:hypothetical protein
MPQEAVACGAFQKYPSKLPCGSYKRSPLLTFMKKHTREQERRRASFLPRL